MKHRKQRASALKAKKSRAQWCGRLARELGARVRKQNGAGFPPARRLSLQDFLQAGGLRYSMQARRLRYTARARHPRHFDYTQQLVNNVVRWNVSLQ